MSTKGKTLKLVTFETDLTQFLVEAENPEEAIRVAMRSNAKIGNTDEIVKEVNDKTQYTVEEVNFDLLAEIFRRTDYAGRYGKALVFYN